MTGMSGCFSLTSVKKSKPEPPGMRMSLTITCGNSFSNISNASAVEENVLNARSARAKAFSNTQRIDLSSSNIQIGFMCSIYLKLLFNNGMFDGRAFYG